ncbi:MAG: hypothetical protein A2148_10675 [Chloroflexi bacterium RBG_16_68_14]|nr:MAG: hypothetical protein A2148_10675 [Chloroflexi bacterium RBG_16_68_14]
MQDWLLSQRPVDVVRELQLNALDLLDQHQYRMAVIEARTSLEIAVDEALLSAMTAKGVEPRAASDILDCRPSLDATLRDVVDDAKIGKKLGRGCSEYLGINPLNTSLGPKWRRAKQLREDASHHGRIVNQHEAVEAVELMSEMISLIRASAARPA